MDHAKRMKWFRVIICAAVLCVITIFYHLIVHQSIDWEYLAITLFAYLAITAVIAAVRKVNKKLN